MNYYRKLVLLILYIGVGIYILLMSIYKPHLNWDMLMYIAIAKSYEEKDIQTIHTFTYKTLEEQLVPSRYNVFIEQGYGSSIYSDLSAFEEQMPFYLIRPLYTGSVYFLYKAGFNIVLATHLVSGIAIVLALILLYFMSVYILGYPFAFTIPFFVLIFTVVNVAKYSTPDGMAFLAIVLSSYLFLKNKLMFLHVFIPIMIGVRTDLILFVIPLLFIIALTRRKFTKMAIISAFISIFFYFTINIISGNPGWSTLFYHTFVQVLTHPLSNSPKITFIHYINALFNGLKGIPYNSHFLLYCLGTLYYIGVQAKRVRNTSYVYVIKSPETTLFLVNFIFVLTHFILFPVTWDRFFIGPYLIGTFLTFVMLTNCIKEITNTE